jgi:hypothetical protein
MLFLIDKRNLTLRSLLLWEDDTIVATQVHESEEAQQTVIVGIEVTVLERLMLRIPQTVYKLLALSMGAHDGSSSGSGDKTNGMA